MLLSLFMATFAIQTADDGFSKLQIFLQQLINWSVDPGGRRSMVKNLWSY